MQYFTINSWKSNVGALAEHLSVLIHAFRRAAFSASQAVLLYGVGTIGLLAVRWQRLVAARVSQPLISIKPGSPSPRGTALLQMCFVSPLDWPWSGPRRDIPVRQRAVRLSHRCRGNSHLSNN
jgi:hypothetical protein